MIAEILREEHPEEFKLLCETPVEWQDEGVEEDEFSFRKLSHLPTFQTDPTGQINRINYSHQQRSSFQPCAALNKGAEGVGRLYRALELFDRVAHSAQVQVGYKMEEGECVAFDNRRVLHGRSSYAGGAGRHLVGWYVDWDEIWSRINVLKAHQ